MKKTLLIILGVLAILIIAGGVWYYLDNKNKAENRACTMEAKLCPDGSYVGRVAPNCEFAECPDEINFSKTGNLIKNNPGFDKDAWYLSYEESGKPGLSIKLKFNDNGMIEGLIIGQRVTIEGTLTNDNEVVVSKIIKN